MDMNMDLLVLDTNYISMTVIDHFTSVIWTDRFDEYGDFELYLPMELELLKYLKEDHYFWSSKSDRCMIIENIAINSDAEEGAYLTVTGRSLESILERRIVWGQKEVKGNLQAGIKTLIEESIINPSIVDRKIDNFIFVESTDPKITALTIDTQFTGDDLYTVVSFLCKENKIGFKVLLNDSNQLVFSLYAGIDRSYKQILNPYVIFSPNYDNMINSNYYTSKADLKTVTLIAGEGEGKDRKTAVVGSGKGLARRELFTDARDISSNVNDKVLTEAEYKKLLESRGTKQLSEHIAKVAFEGEVEFTRLFKYGEDFFVGDIVQIANEYGHEGSAYISEIVISQNEEGFSVFPTFKMTEEKKEEGTE